MCLLTDVLVIEIYFLWNDYVLNNRVFRKLKQTNKQKSQNKSIGSEGTHGCLLKHNQERLWSAHCESSMWITC